MKNKNVTKDMSNYTNNEEMKKTYLLGKEFNNWNDFFNICEKISKGIVFGKYPNLSIYYNLDEIVQESLLEIWKLILRDKIDPNNNIFSYVTGRVYYLCNDLIRKGNRRKNKIAEVDAGELLDKMEYKSL